MKKTNGESDDVQAGSDIKGWMPPENWWERPGMLS